MTAKCVHPTRMLVLPSIACRCSPNPYVATGDGASWLAGSCQSNFASRIVMSRPAGGMLMGKSGGKSLMTTTG
jgi:hypothetical protein